MDQEDTFIPAPTAWPKEIVPPEKLFVIRDSNVQFVSGKSTKLSDTKDGTFWVCFAIAPLVATILLIISAYPDWSRGNRIDSGGVTAEAEIIHYRTEDHYSRRGSYTDYHVTFTFTTSAPEGVQQAYTVEQEVPIEIYRRTQLGEHVSIRYLPEDPSVATLASHNAYAAETQTAFLAMGITVLATAGSAIAGVYKLRRGKRLTEQGQWIPGWLLECTGKNVYKSGFCITVRYAFCKPDGTQLVGQVNNSPRKDLVGSPVPPRGTPIAVRYVDDNCYEAM